jgi:DNA-binding NtrC family response regulator
MAASQAQWPAALNAGAPAGGVLLVASASRDRRAVRDRVARCSVPVDVAVDLSDALARAATRRFALCLIDLAGERTALSAIRLFRTEHPAQPLAGIIDPACPLATAQALDAGLRDLLPWPFDERDLRLLVSNALDRQAVEVDAGPGESPSTTLFAQAPAMRGVVDAIRVAVAAASSGVCISGEPGSGRERIARIIHALSHPASTAPFIGVDCHATARHDLEQRLFGIAGRHASRPAGSHEPIGGGGAIARAQGGTLYLGSLLEMPSAVQARLARLLRDGEAIVRGEPDEAIQNNEPDGRTVDLEVRTIGSCEPGVEAAVAEGRLRRDLFERLGQIRIEVPPLRRRRQDIPLLAVHFLAELADADASTPRALSRAALALLSALPWHGNAEELRTLLETVTRATRRPVIEIDDLLEHATLDGISARLEAGMTLRDARARFERECISAVLMRHHGRVGEAAKALGIQRTNLYRKVRQLKVSRSLLSARK